MDCRIPIAVLSFLAIGSVGFAQVDRRDRADPEIALDHGGRVGFCDMMRWDSEGKYLFAAGDDKCVSVWPLDLTAAKAPELRAERTSAKTLRWPSWRETRGGIKNFAVHPNGGQVAVGGVGMITSAVGLLSRSLSTADKTVVEGYTWPRSNGRNFGTVSALAYSSDGKRVAFGTADGSLWVWTPAKLDTPEPKTTTDQARSWTAPLLAGRHTIPADWPQDEKKEEFWRPSNLFSRSRLVFFLDANTLVSVSMSGQVVACDVSADAKLTDDPDAPVPEVKELFHLNQNGTAVDRVFRAEVTPDNRLSVAFMGPRVRVCGFDGDGVDIPLTDGQIPYSVAVEPAGRVAIAVGGPKAGTKGEPEFYIERRHEVWVYDGVKPGAKPTLKWETGWAEALAFHPTRKGLLAVAGGDADEVRLFDLTGKSPTEPTSAVRGAGRKMFAVGIAGDTLIALKVQPIPDPKHPNELADGDWVGYDLSRQRTAPLPKGFSTARNEADGWRVIPDDAPPKARLRSRWYAVVPEKQRVELTFDHNLYNDPTCYTFIPKSDTTPTRLLVGHAHGCSLFELPAENGPVKRTPKGEIEPVQLAPAAVYVGHTTNVLSVAAAKDGTWFITGGADHTVAAFALKKWDHNPTLGVSFDAPVGKDELWVKDVAIGSPGWEAGLKKGERVTRVVVGRTTVPYNRVIDDKLKVNIGTAHAAAEILARPAVGGVELYIEVAGQGDDRIRLTTVKQRPVWKWFPAFAPPAEDAAPHITDSVVWMWKGPWYHSMSANGDEQVGWHLNAPDVIDSPRFLRLRDLSEQFRKTVLLRKLLMDRDVAAVLTAALGKDPQPFVFSDNAPAPVELLVRDKQTDGGKVRVKVTVNPIGTNTDLLPERVELWVNDYRMEQLPTVGVKKFEREFVIDADRLRTGDNRITVMTYNHLGGRVRVSDGVTNTRSPASNPLLVGWVGGVNGYLGKNAIMPENVRAAFGDLHPLKFAVPDAKAVSTRFDDNTGRGKLYRDNQLKLLIDAAVGRKSLVEELDRLAKPGAVKPDDTLVIFLAGHGVLIGDKNGNTEAIPLAAQQPEEEYANIRFAFCGINFNPSDPTTTGVPAEVLFEKLVNVNCRKLVFLDVCHAGGVLEVDVIRQLLPEGQGPFVFAACGISEQSREDPQGRHGLFTRSLLDATGDMFRNADRDLDGELNCQELVKFCTSRVQDLRRQELKAKDPNVRDSDQNPVSNVAFTAQPLTAVFKSLVAK